MLTADTQIDKLFLHNAAGQDIAVKMSLASVLNNSDLRPVGVSPTDVLIVRHLSDPKPGQLSLDSASLRPNAAWETAVRQSLTACYQQAARPEQGLISSDAEAVLFADESEMLACLALALVRGEAWQRWWWQVPLRSLPAHALDALTASLCRSPSNIPAAIHLLTTWRQAGTVVAHLSKQQVESILNELAAVYALPSLLPVTTIQSPSVTTSNEQANDGSPTLTSSQSIKTTTPPWQPLHTSYHQPTGLTKLQAYLWGWSVSLYATPSTARRPEFRQEAQKWLRTPSSTAMTTTPQEILPSEPDLPHQARNMERTLSEEEITAISPSPQKTKQNFHQQINKKDKLDSDSTQTPHQTQRDMPDKLGQQSATPTITTHPPKETATPPVDNLVQPEILADESALSADEYTTTPPETAVILPPQSVPTPPISLEDTTSTPSINWTEGIPTQLAGVFYLINVMQQLDLPSCFDKTWVLSYQLSPWALLDLLARGLLTAVDEDLLSDPVWTALAELDGRLPGTIPGTDFHDSPTYALPLTWFPQEDHHLRWLWASNGRYLRIWAENKFVICQQPMIKSQTAAAQAKAWFSQAGFILRPVLNQGRFADAPIELLGTPLLAGLSPDASRWLGLVLPFIRHWLQSRLSELGSEPIDIAQDLLWQNGRLYLSSSHVDLVMPLSSIKLPVRLTGLDLDPGWLPDFGRVVQFHFE